MIVKERTVKRNNMKTIKDVINFLELRDEKIRLLEEQIIYLKDAIEFGEDADIDLVISDFQQKVTSLTKQINQETPQSQKKSDERGKEVKRSAEHILKKNNVISMMERRYTFATLEGIYKAMYEFASQSQPEITDDMIEKQFPSDLNEIKRIEKFDVMSYEAEKVLAYIRNFNLLKQEGAKWLRDKLSLYHT